MSTAKVSWLQVGEQAAASTGAQAGLYLGPDALFLGSDALFINSGVATGAVARISWLQVSAQPVETPPVAPASVAGAAIDSSSATLTISDSSDNELGFQFQLSVSGSGAWFDAAGATNPTAPNVTTLVATGLAPATLYSVRVRPFNGAGFGAYTQGPDFGTDNAGSGEAVIASPHYATVAYTESAADSASIAGTVSHAVAGQAQVAYVEAGSDAVTVGVSVAFQPAIRTAEIVFVEQGEDQAFASAVISHSYTASLAYFETGTDSAAILGHYAAGRYGSIDYFEQGSDSAEVFVVHSLGIGAQLAYFESADGASDTFDIRIGVLTNPVQEGVLVDLAAEFFELRSASGLFIGYAEVLQCAIKATRFYCGYGVLADPTAAAGVFSVTGKTSVTFGEWVVIAPLFSLYCERESAIVIEASKVMGAEAIGRSSSEVASDIERAEEKIAMLAYVEDVFTIGGDPDTVAGPSSYVAYPVGALPFRPS